MRKKVKFLLFGVLSFVILQNISIADTTSANAGCRTKTVYNSQSAPLLSGSKLQYLWLKNTYVYGPIDSSGNVNSSYEDVRPNPFPEAPYETGMLVGYDAVGDSVVSGTDGKFWYQASAEGNSQKLIVRAWDSSNSYFGESEIFWTPSNNNSGAINTDFLKDFSTIFPPTKPNVPSPATAESTKGSGSDILPTITVTYSTQLGTRYYVVNIYKNQADTTPYRSSGPIYYDIASHFADPITGNKNKTYQFTNLLTTDGGQKYYYKVSAVNSFGISTAEGEISIDANSDPYYPVPITDLKTTLESTSKKITLKWTAPYDKNNVGNQTNCALYEIRVLTAEAIINQPVSPFTAETTNPNLLTNWGNAVPIETYFQPNNVTKSYISPSSFKTTELATITATNAPNGAYYFAIKAQDASGNLSYISNVAGVTVGNANSQAETQKSPWPITDLKITDEGGGRVLLTWSAPYDLNDSEIVEKCKEYDIRVSTEAIISEPQEPLSTSDTNPDKTSNWDSAIDIKTYFSNPNLKIDNPAQFGTKESLEFWIPTNGTYYFAIKAKDNQDNYSYISNIAGVKIDIPQDVPWPITDVVATKDAAGTAITLTWTAPYHFDTIDTYSVQAPSTYDIRVSTESIIDGPQSPLSTNETNPYKKSNWNFAKLLAQMFPSSTITYNLSSGSTKPGLFGSFESVTISNIDKKANYYFAIKSENYNGGAYSYISNIAGISLLDSNQSSGSITFEVICSFETSSTIGINQFSIPFSAITFEGSTSKAISTMADLVSEIKAAAGSSAIKTIGWWNPTTQKMVGWTGIDSSNIQAYNGAPDINTYNIIKDKVYQMSVSKPITFKISGIR